MVTFVIAAAYLIFMIAALVACFRQHSSEATLWRVALVLGAAAASWNLFHAEWLLAGLWAFNTAICVWNVYLARRKLRLREIEAMWRARFEHEAL